MVKKGYRMKWWFRHRFLGSCQAGLTLLESLLSVGVVAAGLSVVASLQISQMDFEKAAVAAQQHRIVHYAARRYLRDFYGGLTAEASTSTSGVTNLDVNDMLERGYVPNFMIADGKLRPNPYGKTYEILIRRVGNAAKGEQLEMLTLAVGGRELSRTMAGRIVSVMGAEAGFVSMDGQTIDGAYGSWQIQLSDFPADKRPAPNTLANLAFYRQVGGVYVNPYQVNIPAMADRHDTLPRPAAISTSAAYGNATQGVIIGQPEESTDKPEEKPALPPTPVDSTGFGIYGAPPTASDEIKP
jgi:type II secretory pathway pseudopilin PulG